VRIFNAIHSSPLKVVGAGEAVKEGTTFLSPEELKLANSYLLK